MANAQYQTAGVLVSLRSNGGWVEHFELHVPGPQSVARVDNSHGDLMVLERLHQQADAWRVLLREARCRGHLANRKTLQQGHHSVKVIEIRMRKEDFVDPADAAVPEVGCDLTPRDIGTAERSGVIQQRTPIGCFQ